LIDDPIITIISDTSSEYMTNTWTEISAKQIKCKPHIRDSFRVKRHVCCTNNSREMSIIGSAQKLYTWVQKIRLN